MKKLAAFVLFLAFAFAQPMRAQTIPATASLTTQGTAAACTATSTACLYVLLGPGTGATGIELSGTWTGTVSFYGAITASGVTKALASTDASPITSATANGAWQFNTAAFTRVLVVFTTASTGTVKVSVTNSNASARATGGSGGGGGSPTGSQGDVQLKNGSLFGNGSLNDNGLGVITNTGSLVQEGNLTAGGPNPDVDITSPAYGARAGSIHTTATGSGTSITVGSSSFANGNYIAVAGGGANCGLGAVGAPTVVPGESESETVLDAFMTAGVTGSSTYNYIILAEDALGCVSQAGTATTITTGTAALGKTTVTLSAISLTGTTLSFTSSAAHGLVQNVLGHITAGANSFYLSGWFTINTITDSTHAGAVNTVENAPTTESAASGSLVYFIGNNINWSAPTGTPYRYYVCAERPGDGAYHIIGQALPGTTQFVDFGWNLTQTIPWWISDANCNAVSSQPQLAQATITGGGGTTGLTISPGLTNTVTGAGARLDNSLALHNALIATQAISAVYIPTGTFELNSPANIPGDSGVIQAGQLTANAPIIWTGEGGSWSGLGYKGFAGGSPQFAAGAGPKITCNANPCLDFWTHDAIGWDVSKLTVAGNDNGVLSVWAADFTNHFHEIEWVTGADNNDNMGIALFLPPGVPWTNSCENCFIGGGPAQNIDQTWSPLVYLKGNAASGDSGIILRNGIVNRRGVFLKTNAGNGGKVTLDNFYSQGGITPLMAYENNLGNGGGRFYANMVTLDTTSQALLAIWGPNSNMYLQYHIEFSDAPQNDGGGTPAAVTGSGSFSAEWIGDRLGDTTVNNSATSAGVGFKFDGLDLIATNDIIPIGSNNLGRASNPWNNFYFTGSIIDTANAPWLWAGVEGSCSGATAGKDVLCIGDSATHQALESDNGGPFLPLGAVKSVFTRTGAVTAQSGDYTLDLIGNPAANTSFSLGSFNLGISAAGVFTSAAQNDQVLYTLTGGSSCTPLTVLNLGGSTFKLTDNVASCITLPSSGVTNAFTNGFSSYIHNSNSNTTGQNGWVGAVGYYSQVWCDAPSAAHCWGADFSVSDSATHGGGATLLGNEYDVTVNNNSTTGWGTIYTFITGAGQPTANNFPAVTIRPPGGSGTFTSGFQCADGSISATNNHDCVMVGQQASGNSSNSQAIQIFAADAGGQINAQMALERDHTFFFGGMPIITFRNVTSDPAGYGVGLTATATLSAHQLVKIDTAHADSVVVCTTADTSCDGFVANLGGAGTNCGTAQPLCGIITTTGSIAVGILGTGTCSIGNYVIVDTTTNGDIQCTGSLPTISKIIGKALSAQSTVGQTLDVLTKFE